MIKIPCDLQAIRKTCDADFPFGSGTERSAIPRDTVGGRADAWPWAFNQIRGDGCKTHGCREVDLRILTYIPHRVEHDSYVSMLTNKFSSNFSTCSVRRSAPDPLKHLMVAVNVRL